jgi:uncharacterized protein (DUF433 family)
LGEVNFTPRVLGFQVVVDLDDGGAIDDNLFKADGQCLATRQRRCCILLDIACTTRVIVKDPQILHGTPVFRGTRLPVKALFDSLEAGETLEEFLQRFPSVTREMAIAALDEAHELLSAKP